MELKRLLKRGALVAAANWPAVLAQFLARIAYQALVAVPVVGAAVLVVLLLGGEHRLFAGGFREMLPSIFSALLAEPAALAGFALALGIALVGATALVALVKGGVVPFVVRAEAGAEPLEAEALFFPAIGRIPRPAMREFFDGAARHFRRFVAIGLLQLATYGVSVTLALGLLAYSYRALEGRALLIGWPLLAMVTAATVVVWIAIVNLFALLMQIAIATGCSGLLPPAARVLRFAKGEARTLVAVFGTLLVMVVIATVASALAWSGIALVGFVPLVGLAVVPLQIAALVVRGLVFEYIALTGMGAYAALYRRHAGVASPVMERAGCEGHPATATR